MSEFFTNAVTTIRHPVSTSRLRRPPSRHTRATTFIEYAILALIVIAIGGAIYGILTGAIEGVFSNVVNFLKNP
jgi:Flp pilus assembly pilin Flp